MSLSVFYGGTFDPVHHGHLAVARAARDTLGASVRLMPAGDPPHREVPGATAADRARMLELAIAGEPGLAVDRRELVRAARSYSIDTLRELRAEIGATVPVALLVGADSLRELPTWKDWRQLFEHAHFVVAERPGQSLDAGLSPELEAFIQPRWADSPAALLDTPGGRVFRLRQPLRPESATEIRGRIASGRPWRHLVPEAVAEYIERHGLYTGRVASPAPL